MSIGQGVLLRFCRLSTRSVLVFIRMVPVGLISFALLLPANAQYWADPWGGRQQHRQQLYNPFGGGFWGDRPGGFWGDSQAPRYPRQREREREQPPDYSRAPPATPRKDAIVKIVVMGDANADWLAYGLEDAYADNPEIGIVRNIAPILASSAMTCGAILTGRRWRARSSLPRNRRSSCTIGADCP